MFIYSMRASTIKFAGIIGVALVTLVALIVFIPSFGSADTDMVFSENESMNFEKIKTNEDRINFLAQFGWEVKPDPQESQNITIPSEFDKVFAGYNDIQKSEGLDLSKYKKKDMMRYTYEVTNYPGYDKKVLANIIVYKDKVVGGDICSADMDGFIHGFTLPKTNGNQM